MKTKIFYANLRHGYIKIVNNEIVIQIPNKLKNDTDFLNKLLIKSKKFVAKLNSKKAILIEDDNYFYFYSDKILKNSVQYGTEFFLREIFYKDCVYFLDFYSKKLGYKYNKLSLKFLKSKWGSCDYKQDIVINNYLGFLPKKYLEYVCAHEITHLKHKNHSDKFYNELQNLFPEYLFYQKALKNTKII